MARNELKVVIIHGTQATPEDHWFPWLAGALRREGVQVLVPRFPTPEGQCLESWKMIFAEEVGELDRYTVLVGHSIGAAFALQLLQASAVPISGAFLVAGFARQLGNAEFDRLNETFVGVRFNWPAIRQTAKSFKVYNSDNDPYGPLEFGQETADGLGVPLTVIENGGHLNAAAGYRKFELLQNNLREVLALR